MAEININTFAPNIQADKKFAPLPSFGKRSSICIIGAGAFGGWTALHLLRAGYKVTLLDAWGAGNSRSSSGDETRVIRSTYGNNELYFSLNVRALELWKETQKSFAKPAFINSGVLWFCYEEKTPIVDDSIPFAQKHRMEYEYLTAKTLKERFPFVNTEDLHHAYFDPYGGYLKAREATQEVTRLFIAEGGRFEKQSAIPGKIRGDAMQEIILHNGATIRSDAFIFACGPWLSTLFPEFLASAISCTKQEVYYFGAPKQEADLYDNFPAWIDVDGKDFYYGIAGNKHRGFKIGVDKRGPSFDPTHDERLIDAEVLREARQFLSHRFPGLTNAPLLENRVCPYESSGTGNFIFDLHPLTTNTFFLGGGSGHGFKHGPALGELVGRIISGEAAAPDQFRLPMYNSH